MSKFDRYRCFIAVVEQETMAEAAAELFTSPSNVSKQLAKLEQELNVQLVDRTTYKLSVTEPGSHFYHLAKDIVLRVENAEREISKETSETKGRLSIAIPQGLLKTRFFLLLEEFTSLHPDIRYDLRVSNDKEDLIDDKIDLAFRIGDINAPSLKKIHLSRLQTVLCAAPAYLERFPNLTLKKMLKGNHSIVPSYLPMSTVNKIFSRNNLKPEHNFSDCHKADDSLVVDALAIAGLGVTATLDIAVRDELESGRLVRVFPRADLPEVDLHLIYHSRDYTPAKVSSFANFMNERFNHAITLDKS